METLQISRENAIKAYEEANDKGKLLLTNLFGKKVLLKSILERVTTWEDVCEEAGIDPNYRPDVSGYHPEDRESVIADYQARVISRVINEGWLPDFNNPSQKKYYNYWQFNGSGFSLYVVFYGAAFSGVGARHYFKSEAHARHAATCFPSIYTRYLLP